MDVKKLAHFLLFSTVLILGSCSKGEGVETPALIQASVGSYTYSGWFFSGSNIGNRTDINGTLSLSAVGEEFTITLDGVESIQSGRIVFSNQSEKFGFDIEPALLNDGVNQFNRAGWGDMILERQPYDGLYDDEFKCLFVTYIISAEGQEDSFYFIKGVKN